MYFTSGNLLLTSHIFYNIFIVTFGVLTCIENPLNFGLKKWKNDYQYLQYYPRMRNFHIFTSFFIKKKVYLFLYTLKYGTMMKYICYKCLFIIVIIMSISFVMFLKKIIVATHFTT